MRSKNNGGAADFAFLLLGPHYLKDDGVMAIILPHGVLFRSSEGDRMAPSHDTASGRATVRENRTLELIGADRNTPPRPETR
jgi:type I restriction-modification system DNA methylase subunit